MSQQSEPGLALLISHATSHDIIITSKLQFNNEDCPEDNHVFIYFFSPKSIIPTLMMHAKRLRKIPNIPPRRVPGVVFLQHECALAAGTSASQSRCERLPHVCLSFCLYESTWSPLLCRLHAAGMQ